MRYDQVKFLSVIITGIMLCIGDIEHADSEDIATSVLDVVVNPYASTVLFYNNFDDDPLGIYSTTTLATDWKNPRHRGVKQGHARIIEGSEAFQGKSLQILYPQGKYALESGVAWVTSFSKSYEELYCSYVIKFTKDFDFRKGGKLPGLAGGIKNAGGKKPNGYDGWSARIMWRREGKLVQYVYHPDQPTKYGEDFAWATSFILPGIWYRVETYVRMNTPKHYDGIIQSWLNGKQVLDLHNIRLRDTGVFSNDGVRFETFFGGNDATWAPSKDMYAYFDEFIISTAPITHK